MGPSSSLPVRNVGLTETPAVFWGEEVAAFRYERSESAWLHTMLSEWHIESGTGSIVEVFRELKELRSELSSLEEELKANKDARLVEVRAMDLPDFPPEKIEATAKEVLTYLDRSGGTTDIVDFAERTDSDPRLVAQAFRLLQRRGELVEA